MLDGKEARVLRIPWQLIRRLLILILEALLKPKKS